MSTTAHRARVNDGYLDLVRRFPLRAIRSERDHAAAGRILNRLLGRRQPPLSHGECQYLDALIELTRAYESQADRFRLEKMQPIEIVRYLMEQNDMNAADIGKVLGNKTAASLVLSGKRELSKAHIRKLAARFKVEPGLFL
jgi:HTH-type transcriptional regulator / antitoxin HigA